jgi:hypothetical protein
LSVENNEISRGYVVELVDGFMSASIRKDVDFMNEYLHADFLFATPSGTLFDYETFFRDFLLNAKFALLQFERLHDKVIFAPGLALLNGIVKARFQGSEEQFERISFLWVPGKKDWALLQIHSTFTTKP